MCPTRQRCAPHPARIRHAESGKTQLWQFFADSTVQLHGSFKAWLSRCNSGSVPSPVQSAWVKATFCSLLLHTDRICTILRVPA